MRVSRWEETEGGTKVPEEGIVEEAGAVESGTAASSSMAAVGG